MIKIPKNIQKIAVIAAKKAGEELLKRYQKFNRATVRLKSHHEIVTKADLAAEKIILNEIRKNFPGHNVLSEEKGDIGKKSDYLWVVDPLDGTTNFSIHNPLWSVSIGVFYKNEIIFGVIYAPVIGELYAAQKSGGAKCNNNKINVSKTKDGKVINTFCHGSRNKDIKKALKYLNHQKINHLDCRQLGSAAIEFAYVASGRIESIMIPGAYTWDIAAGVLLVREAGGRVTDFSGKRWEIKSEDVVASNGKVHKGVLKIINQK